MNFKIYQTSQSVTIFKTNKSHVIEIKAGFLAAFLFPGRPKLNKLES